MRVDRYALFPLIRYTDYKDDPGRMEAFLFPLIDFTKDERRYHFKLLDVLGLFTLLDWEWGIPKSDGGRGHSYSFLNVLNMVRLVGGGNAGEWGGLCRAHRW